MGSLGTQEDRAPRLASCILHVATMTSRMAMQAGRQAARLFGRWVEGLPPQRSLAPPAVLLSLLHTVSGPCAAWLAQACARPGAPSPPPLPPPSGQECERKLRAVRISVMLNRLCVLLEAGLPQDAKHCVATTLCGETSLSLVCHRRRRPVPLAARRLAGASGGSACSAAVSMQHAVVRASAVCHTAVLFSFLPPGPLPLPPSPCRLAQLCDRCGCGL